MQIPGLGDGHPFMVEMPALPDGTSYNHPDPVRAADSAEALRRVLTVRRARTTARAVDLCCSQNHRVGLIYRVAGRRLVLALHMLTSSGIDRPLRPLRIRMSSDWETDWLDDDTNTWRGGVRTTCADCGHVGWVELRTLRGWVPPSGHVRRVVPDITAAQS